MQGKYMVCLLSIVPQANGTKTTYKIVMTNFNWVNMGGVR